MCFSAFRDVVTTVHFGMSSPLVCIFCLATCCYCDSLELMCFSAFRDVVTTDPFGALSFEWKFVTYCRRREFCYWLDDPKLNNNDLYLIVIQRNFPFLECWWKGLRWPHWHY